MTIEGIKIFKLVSSGSIQLNELLWIRRIYKDVYDHLLSQVRIGKSMAIDCIKSEVSFTGERYEKR